MSCRSHNFVSLGLEVYSSTQQTSELASDVVTKKSGTLDDL